MHDCMNSMTKVQRTAPHGKERQNQSTHPCITKLRVKYKWIKDQWCKLRDRAKIGSSKAPIDAPAWFKILDPIFSETHSKTKDRYQRG